MLTVNKHLPAGAGIARALLERAARCPQCVVAGECASATWCTTPIRR